MICHSIIDSVDLVVRWTLVSHVPNTSLATICPKIKIIWRRIWCSLDLKFWGLFIFHFPLIYKFKTYTSSFSVKVNFTTNIKLPAII